MAQHWKKKREKNNLGTSSIFHEFSFRPKPPLTVVDRSSCCHIFNTWGYSCSLWGRLLTQGRSEAAWVSARTLMLSLLLTCSTPVLATEILATATIANVSPDIPAGKLDHIGSTRSIRMLWTTVLLFLNFWLPNMKAIS